MKPKLGYPVMPGQNVDEEFNRTMKVRSQVTAKTAIAAILGLTMVGTAFAQAPTRIKQHNAWGAYAHNGSAGKICYALSIPTQKRPADRDHGDVFFMLSHHPGQGTTLEPQFTVGYPFKENSKVQLTVDGKTFAMFTRGSNAWMENPAEEPAVVKAMQAGSKMTLQGFSRRGTQTSYDYSLSGVTASLKEISNCK